MKLQAEHITDLESGAIFAATFRLDNEGDTRSLIDCVLAAGTTLARVCDYRKRERGYKVSAQSKAAGSSFEQITRNTRCRDTASIGSPSGWNTVFQKTANVRHGVHSHDFRDLVPTRFGVTGMMSGIRRMPGCFRRAARIGGGVRVVAFSMAVISVPGSVVCTGVGSVRVTGPRIGPRTIMFVMVVVTGRVFITSERICSKKKRGEDQSGFHGSWILVSASAT